MSELVQAPQQNALTTFETAYGSVSLSPQTVRDYLTRGNKSLSDQEVMLFIQLCKYQGLNPFVNEAYAIKFGDNFQMVVGYDTYKRRHCGQARGPDHLQGRDLCLSRRGSARRLVSGLLHPQRRRGGGIQGSLYVGIQQESGKLEGHAGHHD